MKPKILGVIPARLNSTRLHRKLLANICGKPMIRHTFEHAKKAKLLDDLIIAVESKEIADVAKSFNAPVIMTMKNHKTGSDRVGEAVKKYKKFSPDIIVNIWGDNPLVSAKAIDESIKLLLEDKYLKVSGAVARAEKKEVSSPSVVKVVLDNNNYVVYFSRSIIPFAHLKEPKDFYRILGLKVFRKDFLFKYISLPRLPLERTEGIEQMRIIEHGYKMKVIAGNFKEMDVNTKKELEQVRKIICK